MIAKNDAYLNDWLQEFKSDNTRRVYNSALTKFKEANQITNLEKYINDSPDAASDMRKLLVRLEGKPSKTVTTYAGAVKVFLQDKGVKVPDESWSKIRRRGYLPKRPRPQTQDKIPTKTQLKTIVNYLDVKGKALTLFLLSSGARIGETLRIKEEDLNLESDPPKVYIREGYTKGGVGQRTVYMSHEARDAIRDWLAIKNSMGKRDGSGTFKGKRVFPVCHHTAKYLWNRACDKAGLDVRDKQTGRRLYHLHSLRKFFRSKIGLNNDVTHALMGHVEYLDESYLRQEQGEIAEAYLENMQNVSINAVEDLELRRTTEEQKNEITELRKEMAELKAFVLYETKVDEELMQIHKEKNPFSGSLEDRIRQKIEFNRRNVEKYKKLLADR